MSIINIVKNIKQVHPEYIILIKIGKFYYSYSKDAYIISYIFNYKLKIVEKNIKVCAFPVFALNKIIAKLEENKINYIAVDRRNNYEVDGKYAKYRNIKRKIKYRKKLYEIEKIDLIGYINTVNCYKNIVKKL